MSTVKISELASLNNIGANTSNTLVVGVDLATGVTGKFTVTKLSQAIYANNTLNVGNNAVVFPGIIGQFASQNENYLQVNVQNLNGNGSSDIVATADVGSDTTNYIDFGINGSTYNYNGTQPYRPLDGYLIVQGGASGSNPGGNLMIGTLTQTKNIDFVQGGVENGNVVATFIYGSGLKLRQKPLIFADGTTQNTSTEAAGVYANGAFDKANASFLIASTPQSNANSAALYANGAFIQANAAYTKANNALANASGTFAGDLTFTGNIVARSISTSNLISFVGATTPATNALVEIIGSNGAVQQAPSNDGYMLHITGKANTPTRLVLDSFGANTYSLIAGRSGRGTAAAPTAVANGDVIMRISSNGWGTTGFSPLGLGRIDFVATENFTDAAHGTQIQFWNCPIGSNTLTNIATFNGTDVIFTGEVNPQKGLVLTPNVLSGITTTLNVDIANNSLYYFKTNATTTINLNGFKSGKLVEVWLTNTDTGFGSNHTITHGCLANNSTIGASSFTLSSLHSAYIKYFSIDGDLANTFCQVTYS